MLYSIKIMHTFASVYHGIRFKVRRLFVVMTSNFFYLDITDILNKKISEFDT